MMTSLSWHDAGVTSWRDSATEQAQDDLDGLVSTVLPFAQQLLAQNGEFYPFGIAVTADGERRMLAGDPGQGEHPASSDIRSLLFDGLRRNRDGLRAAAVCCDVRLPGSEAIRVELEHRDGPALAVLLPYTRPSGQGIPVSGSAGGGY